MNRRKFIQITAGAALSTGAFSACSSLHPHSGPAPVILATDIGDDIDDTWALGLLLKSPELDLKLVATDYGKSQYRAKLLAKFLQTTGHAQVPVAVGPDLKPRGQGAQAAWIKDYTLASYPGKVHTDGIGAIVDVIMNSPRTVTIICIGPMPNLAAALQREPRIAHRARIVAMAGSVRRGYGGDRTPCPEWNVKADPAAAQKVLSAHWPITITPLDTCGLARLDGPRYQRLLDSHDIVAATVIENYRLWSKANKKPDAAEHHSSTLFDPVAVYLAFSQQYCQMETLPIRVTDSGLTVIDPQAKPMQVATNWKNQDAFLDLLTTRLAP
jgi:inosine-uridine nucleoside N-ribohydrolase